MQMCSVSFLIKEMQTKALSGYYHTQCTQGNFSTMAKIKDIDNISCWWGGGTAGTSGHCL